MRNKPENFHASVFKRVLFNFRSLPKDVPEVWARQFLNDLGFVDIIQKFGFKNSAEVVRDLARENLVGKATYALNAELSNWPDIMNCSGVPGWLYGQIGVEIPTLSIMQYQTGERIFDEFTPKVGDLYFKEGKTGVSDYYDERDDAAMSIGHVGMVIDVDDPKDAIICEAANPHVKETPLKEFIRTGGKYRAACRIVRDLKEWTIFGIPPQLIWRIKTSEALRWLILENVKKP